MCPPGDSVTLIVLHENRVKMNITGKRFQFLTELLRSKKINIEGLFHKH